MSRINILKTPLDNSQINLLQAGDEICLSGIIYSARDMAHKRLCASLEAKEKLPFDLNGAIIYFLGPTPARTGRIIGSAGPTTASRMDAFSPVLFANGLKATIGKGYRNQKVRQALQENRAVHLGALGGAGALLSKYIVSCEIIAYQDLGTEAIRKMEVKDLPLVVAYDANGGCIYESGGR